MQKIETNNEQFLRQLKTGQGQLPTRTRTDKGDYLGLWRVFLSKLLLGRVGNFLPHFWNSVGGGKRLLLVKGVGKKLQRGGNSSGHNFNIIIPFIPFHSISRDVRISFFCLDCGKIMRELTVRQNLKEIFFKINLWVLRTVAQLKGKPNQREGNINFLSVGGGIFIPHSPNQRKLWTLLCECAVQKTI